MLLNVIARFSCKSTS